MSLWRRNRRGEFRNIPAPFPPVRIRKPSRLCAFASLPLKRPNPKSKIAQHRTGATLNRMARVEDAILKNLHTFVAFARKRLGDHHLAEDVVQDSLIKALAADRHPETDEETTMWFYRILRRSIIDVYRKQGAQRRSEEHTSELQS